MELDDNYKNAFFYIIAKYSFEWLKNKNCYKKTENFDDTKNKVVNVNDVVGDFMNDCLIITKNDDDRISKSKMYEIFKMSKPKSLITEEQLMGILNNKDIDYSFKKRVDGKQGAYLGIKIKSDDAQQEDLSNSYLYGKDKNNKELIEAKQKIKELEEKIKQLEELQAKPNEIKVKKNKSIKHVQTVEVEDSDSESDIDDLFDEF